MLNFRLPEGDETPPPQLEDGEEAPPPASIAERFNVTALLAEAGFRDLPNVDDEDEDGQTPGGQLGQCLTMCYPTPQPQFQPFEEDPRHQVQHYTRPAAGMTLEAESRRPPRVLDASMKFLVNHILRYPNPEWNTFYFKKFEYLWDRFRQVRQDWSAQGDQSHRRKKWLEFMIRVFAMRIAACSRNRQDCARFLDVKKNNSESLKDTFGQLAGFYRRENKKRNNEMVAAGILFHGLQLNSKIETYANWLRVVKQQDLNTGGEVLDVEHCSMSVDLVDVYKELAAVPCAAESSVVQACLTLIHALHDGRWFHFLTLCWTLDLPFVCQCLVSSVASYVRFRAVFELVVTRRVRGSVTVRMLTKSLCFCSQQDCLDFLETAGFRTSIIPGTEESPDGPEYELLLTHSTEAGTKQVYGVAEINELLGGLEKAKYKLVFPFEHEYFQWAEAAAYGVKMERKYVRRLNQGSDDDDAEGDDDGEDVDPSQFDVASPECPINYMFYLEEHYPPALTAAHYLSNTGGLDLSDNDGSAAALSPRFVFEDQGGSPKLRPPIGEPLSLPAGFDDYDQGEMTEASSAGTRNSMMAVPVIDPAAEWTPPEGIDLPPKEDGSAPTFEDYINSLLDQAEHVAKSLKCTDLYARKSAELEQERIDRWLSKKGQEILVKFGPEEQGAREKIGAEERAQWSNIIKATAEDLIAVKQRLTAKQRAIDEAKEQATVVKDSDEEAIDLDEEEEEEAEVADELESGMIDEEEEAEEGDDSGFSDEAEEAEEDDEGDDEEAEDRESVEPELKLPDGVGAWVPPVAPIQRSTTKPKSPSMAESDDADIEDNISSVSASSSVIEIKALASRVPPMPSAAKAPSPQTVDSSMPSPAVRPVATSQSIPACLAPPSGRWLRVRQWYHSPPQELPLPSQSPRNPERGPRCEKH